MDEIHVHKTKKSICAHFAESPCIYGAKQKYSICYWGYAKLQIKKIYFTIR